MIIQQVNKYKLTSKKYKLILLERLKQHWE